MKNMLPLWARHQDFPENLFLQWAERRLREFCGPGMLRLIRGEFWYSAFIFQYSAFSSPGFILAASRI